MCLGFQFWGVLLGIQNICLYRYLRVEWREFLRPAVYWRWRPLKRTEIKLLKYSDALMLETNKKK